MYFAMDYRQIPVTHITSAADSSRRRRLRFSGEWLRAILRQHQARFQVDAGSDDHGADRYPARSQSQQAGLYMFAQGRRQGNESHDQSECPNSDHQVAGSR
jgi:hypothetical protein